MTRRMQRMQARTTLGGVFTHDVMDIVIQHLNLIDCFHISEVSKVMSYVLYRRLEQEVYFARFEFQSCYREVCKLNRIWKVYKTRVDGFCLRFEIELRIVASEIELALKNEICAFRKLKDVTQMYNIAAARRVVCDPSNMGAAR